MKPRFLLTMLAFMAATAPALAEDAEISPATEAFIQQTAMNQAFEIRSGNLALERSGRSDVRQFARKMVDEHRLIGGQFRSKLSFSGIDPSTAEVPLDGIYQAMIDSLETAPNSAFDRLYIAAQSDAHAHMIAIFRDYAQSGSHKGLANFALTTLPQLEEHQAMVKSLNWDVSSSY
ncbi:MAG: DUF4142 domain-containing protein [Alphaproteobacteria bacterium]|nr:DUF4142 domain-containing protein [Alphaproteobacteria bacterium]